MNSKIEDQNANFVYSVLEIACRETVTVTKLTMKILAEVATMVTVAMVEVVEVEVEVQITGVTVEMVEANEGELPAVGDAVAELQWPLQDLGVLVEGVGGEAGHPLVLLHLRLRLLQTGLTMKTKTVSDYLSLIIY